MDGMNQKAVSIVNLLYPIFGAMFLSRGGHLVKAYRLVIIITCPTQSPCAEPEIQIFCIKRRKYRIKTSHCLHLLGIDQGIGAREIGGGDRWTLLVGVKEAGRLDPVTQEIRKPGGILHPLFVHTHDPAHHSKGVILFEILPLVVKIVNAEFDIGVEEKEQVILGYFHSFVTGKRKASISSVLYENDLWIMFFKKSDRFISRSVIDHDDLIIYPRVICRCQGERQVLP